VTDEPFDPATAPATLLAAAARCGHPLPAAVAPRLRPLEADGLQVSVAASHDRTVVGVAGDVAAAADSDNPPPLLTTLRERKALIAALAATRDGSDQPYPGGTTTVDEVVQLCRPNSEMAARHIIGAIDALTEDGLLDLDGDVVRPGPRLAAWTDPWVGADLPDLLHRLAPEERP
jgi:hypothetical protein